jgi:hypothetical protein
MDFDPKFALERFRGMTREELVEEAALHADGYVPLVRQMLEGEVRARGIPDVEIEARRTEGATPEPERDIDFPALITSAMEKEELQALAGRLRGEGIPAVVREIDTRAFHGSGCAVGRWGLFVPGPHALEAARRVEALSPETEPAAAPLCGGTCGGQGEEEVESGEWDEDGDWWKTGAPGEEEQ